MKKFKEKWCSKCCSYERHKYWYTMVVIEGNALSLKIRECARCFNTKTKSFWNSK